MDLYFGKFSISKKKEKNAIAYIALCVLCMRVLHGGLQVASDTWWFSTVFHIALLFWCVSEYKSVKTMCQV